MATALSTFLLWILHCAVKKNNRKDNHTKESAAKGSVTKNQQRKISEKNSITSCNYCWTLCYLYFYFYESTSPEKKPGNQTPIAETTRPSQQQSHHRNNRMARNSSNDINKNSDSPAARKFALNKACVEFLKVDLLQSAGAAFVLLLNCFCPCLLPYLLSSLAIFLLLSKRHD